MKEVEEKADRYLLQQSMEMTATANAAAAVVSGLESVSSWNEKERERVTDLIQTNKNGSAKSSLSEKTFIATTKSYSDSHKILLLNRYPLYMIMKWQPGDFLDEHSDEYKQEVLISIDAPSEMEEQYSKIVDKRIMVNKLRLATAHARLKLAVARTRMIIPVCSANKMERDKCAPFPLGQFLECHTQTAWIAELCQSMDP